MPRRYKLSRRVGFSRILNQRALINSWFAVHSESNSEEHARLGMSVSKRVLPAATQRNVAKRMIRECFRSNARHGLPRDVVVRLRKTLSKKDLPIARITLSEMLKTALVVK